MKRRIIVSMLVMVVLSSVVPSSLSAEENTDTDKKECAGDRL